MFGDFELIEDDMDSVSDSSVEDLELDEDAFADYIHLQSREDSFSMDLYEIGEVNRKKTLNDKLKSRLHEAISGFSQNNVISR